MEHQPTSEIVKQHLAYLLEEEQKEKERIAKILEPTLEVPDYQPFIDRMVGSGFAVFDEATTEHWRWYAHSNGWKKYRNCYKWTLEGKKACFRNMYSTPMAWAEDIGNGARHCVVCMRDLHHLKVWAQVKGKPGCVCMECGAKGHGLQDLR